MFQTGRDIVAKFKTQAKHLGCGAPALVEAMKEGRFVYNEYMEELLDALNSCPVEVATKVADLISENRQYAGIQLMLSRIRHYDGYITFIKRTGH